LRWGEAFVKEIVAKTVGQLKEITEVVHDCWFELSKVEFDPDRRWLVVPFLKAGLDGRSVRRHGILWQEVVPLLEAALTIRHVDRFEFLDEPGIDRYDFNEIIFRPDTQELVVTSGFPVQIRATVSMLEVALVVTDTVADHETHTRLLPSRRP
jgi:hypothetical protein